jgi:alkylation response protein AidB-like acyl-CoA dehydrogenase
VELRLRDELELLDATVTAFCERAAGSRAVPGEAEGYDRDVFAEMGAMGWTGLAATDPGERLPLGVVVEALGRAGLASPLRETTGSCGTLLALLPGNVEVERLSSTLSTGGGVASLLHRPRPVTVRWEARGGGVVVDALPAPLDWGQVADHLVCVAADADGRSAVLVVDPGAAGVARTPVRAVDDELPAVVGLDGAPARLLAAPSAELDEALADARALRLLLRAAELVGGADAALAMTVAYVKSRHQFGRPIGSFQAVRHACADMATAVEGLRLTVHEALWRASVGLPFRRHAAGAVIFAARTVDLVTTWASELHGGVGFMADYPLGRFLRHLKAGQVRLGTPADLTGWAAPLLLTPALERLPFPPRDLELLRGLRAEGGSRR